MIQVRSWSRFRSGALLFAFVFAFGMASAAYAANGPEVGPNIRVNDPQQLPPNDWPNRNTPSLAVSEDGERLVALFEDFQGFCGPPTNRPCPAPVPQGLTSFAFSTDGGETWTDAGALPPIGVATSVGHPWIDRGGEGENEVFYAVTRMRGTAASPVGLAGLGVYRGRFSAGTFVWEDARIINSTNPNDQYSRPALAAAKDNSGAAYIVFVNVLEMCGIASFGFGQIEALRTHDFGETWQGPVVISPDAAESSDPSDPLCGVLGPLQVAPAVSVGPQGEVYAVWQKGPRALDLLGNTETSSSIGFSRSLDGGATFDPPRTLVAINANYQNTPVGHGKSRQNDQPRTAAAWSGPYNGRAYVTFNQPVQPVNSPITVQSAVSAEAFITYSDDQGLTWSTPAPIAPPVAPTGVKRLWPTVSIRPGGAVDVVYLESRETQATPDPTDIECNMPTGVGRRIGPLSSLVDTWWVQSRDGGATFGPPVRVSEQTSNWCTTFYTFSNGVFSNYGDYLGTASGGNRTFVLWPDGRNGVTDVFFAEVKGKVDKK
ncbi:MAG TPA: sialidase family protein [Thermoanaerobaculia bacterium]|nr:sialidase family protein [Thermoanaerobaculia bacterium]